MLAVHLEIEEHFIQNRLQELGLTHLHVQTHSRSVIVFSTECDRVVEKRAIFTRMQSGDYALSIVDQHDHWELLSVVGPLAEMVKLLTEELLYVLEQQTNYQSISLI
ncbi:MAG: hypothetical protein P0Y55_00985 [Candidatus Cohnella colombiensis]|uniref:Uncharacterized protein n=1 Tax=Candidatus Cohnella colombiensis TaxID=3121368 RepID=A0AA95JAS1_9BACL|nr:MAG: hypothetical protein P0Y55_00985 [Cohnella sp.]